MDIILKKEVYYQLHESQAVFPFPSQLNPFNIPHFRCTVSVYFPEKC
jgi:hypothetical protein